MRRLPDSLNLGEFAAAANEKQFDTLDEQITRFQRTVQRIRYAKRPVVSAIRGMALGGACEIAMASSQVVAALESYLGLVELGVGLVPAAGGTVHLVEWAGRRAATEKPDDILPFLSQAFKTVALARISGSALDAQELGFIDYNARIVMNEARCIYVAKEEVLRLSNEGYLPPPSRSNVMVLGHAARAAFEIEIEQMRRSGIVTAYDQYLANRLAHVMTGGDISSPALVSAQYLFDLEKETILSLFGQDKTLERISSILKTNRRLRN